MASIPVSFTMSADGNSDVYETSGGTPLFQFTGVGGATMTIQTEDAGGTFGDTGDSDATVSADGSVRVRIGQMQRVRINKTGHTTNTDVLITY